MYSLSSALNVLIGIVCSLAPSNDSRCDTPIREALCSSTIFKSSTVGAATGYASHGSTPAANRASAMATHLLVAALLTTPGGCRNSTVPHPPSRAFRKFQATVLLGEMFSHNSDLSENPSIQARRTGRPAIYLALSSGTISAFAWHQSVPRLLDGINAVMAG